MSEKNNGSKDPIKRDTGIQKALNEFADQEEEFRENAEKALNDPETPDDVKAQISETLDELDNPY